MKHNCLAILMFALVVFGGFFIGCNVKERRSMPKSPLKEIVVIDRMEVLHGPTKLGRWRCYIIKDTLTEKQYLVIGRNESISVTPLNTVVEK